MSDVILQVVDSHTGGEPTRIIIAGGPDLGRGPLSERLLALRERHDVYRSAVISPLQDALRDGDRDQLRQLRKRVQELLTPVFSHGLESRLPDAMPDEDLVNALAQYLEFDPIEKLALLEQEGPLARCRSIVELLEMKAMHPPGGDRSRVH